MKAIALMAAFAAQAPGQGKTGNRSSQAVTIPLEFAAGRGSLLVRARINRQVALLIVDTGSSHTVLRPSVAGVNPGELAKPRTGAGVIGDAIGQVVTLEIGQRVWSSRRVTVMDLSEALSPYREKIGGLLGLDFLLEFSQVVINLKEALVSFIP
jgi:predicted aspartyl protease